jgi:hypothetical protein
MDRKADYEAKDVAWLGASDDPSASCRSRRVEPRIEYDRPLPPGQLALRKITDPNRFPDFTQGWRDLDSLQARDQSTWASRPASGKPYDDVASERSKPRYVLLLLDQR